MKYTNRSQAGSVLADLLKEYAHRKEVIVLALPRGGVPVAYEIAAKAGLKLDVFIVRKLGVPQQEELAMGALASGATVVFNESVLGMQPIDKATIDAVIQSEQKELIRREHLYRGDKAFPDLEGKTIILVDDGIATGSTMKAAIAALEQKSPAGIVVAVPVAERSTCEEISSLVSRFICPLQPNDFYAVGLWYEDFSQTADEEVIQLLEQAKQFTE